MADIQYETSTCRHENCSKPITYRKWFGAMAWIHDHSNELACQPIFAEPVDRPQA